MEDIIKLEDFIEILKKGWKLIVSITIICTLIAGCISYFVIKPKYESTVKLFIGKQTTTLENNKENIGYNFNEVNMYQNLMETYAQFIPTRNLVGKALNNAGIEKSTENINSTIKNLKVNTDRNTQILSITYISTNKGQVVRVLNSVTNEFINESKELIPNGSIHIIENPVAPTAPISPNKTLNIIIGFIIGLVLSVLLVLLLDYLDNTVKSTDELEKLLGYPVIGAIPEIKE